MSRVDNENPKWTREIFRKAKPAREVFPQLELPNPRKGRGPQKSPVKVQTTIRLDNDIVAHFKTQGRGWQSRINDALRDVVERRNPVKRKTRV
jgi:uncharacterized protein (DUF4415 family)